MVKLKTKFGIKIPGFRELSAQYAMRVLGLAGLGVTLTDGKCRFNKKSQFFLNKNNFRSSRPAKGKGGYRGSGEPFQGPFQEKK